MSKENKNPVFTVEPGRTIAKDGKDSIRIQIVSNEHNRFGISPTEADSLTHLIAKLLNEHFAKNA